MARNVSASLFVKNTNRTLWGGLVLELVEWLALVGCAISLGFACVSGQHGVEVWVGDLHALVELEVDALLQGFRGSDGLVIIGVIRFLNKY